MKKYEKYKDSGVEWIGEIPEHWTANKVKHNFNFKTGFTPPSGKNEYYENGKHVWINISDLQEKDVSDSVNKITDKAIEDYNPSIVPIGSLLYSFKLSVGRVGFNLVECYTNEAIFSIEPDGVTNLGFFYYSLPEQIIKNANENIYGAKILNQELIKNAILVIPPPHEQTAIAAYLDHKTSEIDQLIADKKRLLELYEEEKTAIINQAVTKGINPNVKMKDSGIEWLGEIPEHWEVKKLKHVSTKIGDGIHTTPRYLLGTEIYFINGVNLNDGEITLTDKTLSVPIGEYDKYKIELKEGSILISLNGTIGKLAFYKNEKVILGKSAAYIELGDWVLNRFIYFVLKSQYINNYFEDSFSGTTIKNLSLYTLRNTPFPYMSIAEQKSIFHYIETEITRIDHKISHTEKLIELLTEYRTALISEVVTGKVKVI